MLQRVCLLTLLLGLLVACVHAGHRVEVVPAELPTGESKPAETKRIAFALNDATIEQVVAEVQKQMGLTLSYNFGRETRGPTVVYKFDVDAVTRDEALDQIARGMRMNLSQMGDRLMLQSQSMPIGYVRREVRVVDTQMDGPARHQIDAVRVSQSLARAQLGKNEAAIHLRVWPGPLGMRGFPVVTFTELVDDQDRVLTAPKPENAMQPYDTLLRHPVQVVALFDVPTPRPRKLKRVRGIAQLRVPVSFERLTIDSFEDQPIECKLAGVTLRIGPLKKTANGWSLMIQHPTTLTREEADTVPYMLVMQTMREARLRGANGEPLRIHGNQTGEANGWTEYEMPVSVDDRVPGGPRPTTRPAAVPKPVSMVWDVPNAFRVLELPVEANDLVVP